MHSCIPAARIPPFSFLIHGCLCNQTSVLAVLLAVLGQLRACLAPYHLVLHLFLPDGEGCISLYPIHTCDPELFTLIQAFPDSEVFQSLLGLGSGTGRLLVLPLLLFFLLFLSYLEAVGIWGSGCRRYRSWLQGKEVWFQTQRVLVLHGCLMYISLEPPLRAFSQPPNPVGK